MPLAAALLALAESDFPALPGWLVGGLLGLGPAIYYWMCIVEKAKGHKFDASKYVTREEMNAIRAARDEQLATTIGALRSDFAALRSDFSGLEKFFNEDLPGIHRALGRLEGHNTGGPITRGLRK